MDTSRHGPAQTSEYAPGPQLQFPESGAKRPQGRDMQQGLPFIAVESQGSFQGGEGKLVDANRSEERVIFQRLQEPFFSDDDPRLGAPQQFVTAEGNEIDSRPDKLLNCWLRQACARQ